MFLQGRRRTGDEFIIIYFYSRFSFIIPLIIYKPFFLYQQNMTKGSLWMVEPIHRPQLVQSLCKVSYIKTELIEQLMSEKKPTAKARVVILVS